MKVAGLLVIAALGCGSGFQASSRRVPLPGPAPMRCGTPSLGPRLSFVEAVALGVVATALMGGVVAAGYFAIGGEAPLR